MLGIGHMLLRVGCNSVLLDGNPRRDYCVEGGR